jgi:hypothetical protein
MRSYLVIAIIIFMVAGSVSADIKITPVADIYLSGGQYFLDNDPSSFGGNTSIYYSPVMNFTSDRAIVPVFNLSYSGTRDVEELVGGDVLTTQSIDGGLTLKYVEKILDWKGKVRVGYQKSFLNETTDENWGDGLFDYQRVLFGASIEKEIWDYEFSLILDYYKVEFANYSSLIYEEEYEASIDTQTYTELSSNAGEDVLDYSDTFVALKVNRGFTDHMNASVALRSGLRSYWDQTIVDKDGSFSDELRKDSMHYLDAGIEYAIKKSVLQLNSGLEFLFSNQNSYDAGSTEYIDNYYSYYDFNITPAILFYLGKSEKPSRMKFWWNLDYKKYFDRLAQDVDGNYLNDKTGQVYNTFGFYYSRPITENLSASISLNRRTSASNMKYESNYRYNYTVTNYFAGLNWRY